MSIYTANLNTSDPYGKNKILVKMSKMQTPQKERKKEKI